MLARTQFLLLLNMIKTLQESGQLPALQSITMLTAGQLLYLTRAHQVTLSLLAILLTSNQSGLTVFLMQ